MGRHCIVFGQKPIQAQIVNVIGILIMLQAHIIYFLARIIYVICDNWFIAVEESHHCQGPDHQDAHDGDGHEAAARGFLALHIALVHTLHTKCFSFKLSLNFSPLFIFYIGFTNS